MGKSDPHVFSFYKRNIVPRGSTALLGFTNNNTFQGDLYDLQLDNWNINSDWELPQKYDTIICTRCAYFAKDIDGFIKKCYDSLNDNGCLYVDFGLGDHWRFDQYKVGWKKGTEHEYAYASDNFLWASCWHDSFLNHEQLKLFNKRIKKFGYIDVKEAIYEEVPSILDLNTISKKFDISYDIMTLWEDQPQLYILIIGKRKELPANLNVGSTGGV